MAEGAPLLREYGLKAHRGFEPSAAGARQRRREATATPKGRGRSGRVIPTGAMTARQFSIWRGGRVAEGAPLLREYGLKAHRGFESLPLRQITQAPSRGLCYLGVRAVLVRILRFDKTAGLPFWTPAMPAPAGRGSMDGPESIPPSPPNPFYCHCHDKERVFCIIPFSNLLRP